MKNLEHRVNCIVEAMELQKELNQQQQEILREYVTNKSYLLDKRFNIWSKYCDKRHYSYIIHESTVPLVGFLVDQFSELLFRDAFCNWFKTFYWSYFLDFVEDIFEDKEYDGIKEKLVSTDNFKETLIQENFGSFIMNW